MPVVVRKAPRGGWNIVEEATGKVKGHSDTKKDAKASARIRNIAHMKRKAFVPAIRKKKYSLRK